MISSLTCDLSLCIGYVSERICELVGASLYWEEFLTDVLMPSYFDTTRFDLSTLIRPTLAPSFEAAIADSPVYRRRRRRY